MFGFLSILLWLVLGLITYVILSVLFFQVYNYYKYKKCNIPIAVPTPFLGDFKFSELHLRFLQLRKELGQTYVFNMFYIPIITTTDPELIQLILARKNFPKSSVFENVDNFWGSNLASMKHGEGHPWKSIRRLVNPAFRLGAIKALSGTFVEHSQRFAKKLVEFADTDKSINFQDEISNMTLEIISSAGFSYPLNASPSNGFIKSLSRVTQQATNGLIFLPFGYKLLRWINNKHFDKINDVFYSVIDERIKQMEVEKKDPEKFTDILDFLLLPDEDGKQLTREEIRNELFIFYVGGHETTATVLSWAVYEIAKRPDIEKKLLDEIISYFGPSDGKSFIQPSVETLAEMRYLNMFLNELLRIHSPVFGMSRKIPEDFEWKGMKFLKGTEIFNFQLGSHRNEEYWPNPEQFDPERFTPEQNNSRPPFVYYPFSGGPRFCIGKHFFFQGARMMLATFLREVRFELTSNPDNGVLTSDTGVLKPKAVIVKVFRRTPEVSI